MKIKIKQINKEKYGFKTRTYNEVIYTWDMNKIITWEKLLRGALISYK